MNIAFVLTMPGNNSWNGKWSGDGKLFAVVKSFRKPPVVGDMKIVGHRFGYDFGDGWCANVSVVEVSPADARKFRKNSSGFYGYNWMIDSILQYGKIYADHQKPKTAEAVTS